MITLALESALYVTCRFFGDLMARRRLLIVAISPGTSMNRVPHKNNMPEAKIRTGDDAMRIISFRITIPHKPKQIAAAALRSDLPAALEG